MPHPSHRLTDHLTRWQRADLQRRLGEAGLRGLCWAVGLGAALLPRAALGVAIAAALAGELVVLARSWRSRPALAAHVDAAASTHGLLTAALAAEQDAAWGAEDMLALLKERALRQAPALAPLALRPLRLPRLAPGLALVALVLRGLLPADVHAPLAPLLAAASPAASPALPDDPSLPRGALLQAADQTGGSQSGAASAAGGTAGSGAGQSAAGGGAGARAGAARPGQGGGAASDKPTETAQGAEGEEGPLGEARATEQAGQGEAGRRSTGEAGERAAGPAEALSADEPLDLHGDHSAPTADASEAETSRRLDPEHLGAHSDAVSSSSTSMMLLEADHPIALDTQGHPAYEEGFALPGMGGINDAPGTANDAATPDADAEVAMAEQWVQSRWRASSAGLMQTIEDGQSGGRSEQAWQELYEHYASIAEAQVSRDGISADRRGYVRRYFESIRPERE